MGNSLHFAQISDIHIAADGDHHDLLSGQAAGFLTEIIAHLNQVEDLDFVLFSGDLFDAASLAEFEQFETIVKTLQKPYYVIPGNHDRREPDSNTGLTLRQFARHYNPQFDQRPTDEAAQAGYWSIEISPQIQLIGLDSVMVDDWGGIIDGPQLAWLSDELAAKADKFIILTVHHPLHKLAPVDDLPDWHKFVCDNGPQVFALLDRHPQVKLVLTGHHHLTKADRFMNGSLTRLHLACPAVSIYPCAYRTVRVREQAGGWHVTWQTHPATDEATIALARERMISAWSAIRGFDQEFVETHAKLSLGTVADQTGAEFFAEKDSLS